MWLKEREDWDRFCEGGLEYHCCDDGGYGKLIGDGGDRANEGVVGGKITSRKPPNRMRSKLKYHKYRLVPDHYKKNHNPNFFYLILT
ncbi:hypothetical protein NC652_039741 [Populus alba x Populus x berolinensis]|uniref:Uncharacterized protein n=1 Tax=Populus alba x Populus x berolinensis TaxID=444605 RepID=A0AAD6PQY1_9ROSI|nr:hypothetical protein NC652_039741 [Populus alba x Populus x berolinensis]KAJ6957820.1 hypothetical protein NC653_039714 [Populus alba x Populus x berolinensis]